jgi:hypothetical protein
VTASQHLRFKPLKRRGAPTHLARRPDNPELNLARDSVRAERIKRRAVFLQILGVNTLPDHSNTLSESGMIHAKKAACF